MKGAMLLLEHLELPRWKAGRPRASNNNLSRKSKSNIPTDTGTKRQSETRDCLADEALHSHGTIEPKPTGDGKANNGKNLHSL
jgi:hypothetical protein